MTQLLDQYLRNLDHAVKNEAWYAALALALALPNICSTVEYGKQTCDGYVDWWNEFVSKRDDTNLTGYDVYNLRCAFLHTGTGDLQRQIKAYKKSHLGVITLTATAAAKVRKVVVEPGTGSTQGEPVAPAH